MKIKLAGIGVSILFIILAVLFFSKDNDQQNILSNGCIYPKIGQQSIVSICEEARSTGSVKDPYYDNYCKEVCLKELAYEKSDANICALISHYSNIPKAPGWDDPRETGSVIDYCYIHLASKLKNPDFANNLETDWAKDNFQSLYSLGR